jgi:hypothetical protein
MKQVTTRGPTHSCHALQSRTTRLRSGLLLELRSIALGFFQAAFLALPTWRIHASPLRPFACLRTLITAGGKYCPLHSHTQHPQERKSELCTRNTQFTNSRRAQTRIVYTQHPIHKSQRTHTYTQRNTQEVVGRSEGFKRGWESGYYHELWMRMGLKTGLNHIRRRHKVCSSSLANTRVLLC